MLSTKVLEQAKSITLIHVYAPTLASEEEEVEEFYAELQKGIDSTNTRDILIMLGNLNAEIELEIVRQFAVGGEMTDETDLLILQLQTKYQ